MRINTNTAAMNTYSNLTSANASKSNSLAKLSSGLRINKAGDDAAGLSISEKMKNQISGMTQASRNAQDGISLIQTAEGALTETHSMLNRMRDLTVQAGNDTNTTDDKAAIQSEIKSLTSEIDRVAEDSQFNTKGLLNGGTVTSESITKSGAASADMVKAYNAKFGASVGGKNTATATLATDLAKLSESNLKSVVKEYNSSNNIGDTNFTITAGTPGTPETPETPGTPGTPDTVTATTADLEELASAFNTKFGAAVGGVDTNVSGADVVTAIKNFDEDQLATLTKEYNSANDVTVSDVKELKSSEFSFQIGANSGEKISVEIANMSAKGLGISDIDVTSKTQTTDQILKDLDTAISNVSSQRANLGAVQNRLDHTVSNLATTKENLSEANSRITDVDMAEEMMSFTKSNILSQASTSMLAQANQMPQSVLSLLQ